MPDRLLTDEIPVPVPEARDDALLERELRPALDPAEAADLAQTSAAEVQAAMNDRSEWEARLAEDDEQYHGVLPEKTEPWPGCANFAVPLTMVGVETLKPRLVESVLGEDPPVLVRPVEAADEPTAERVGQFLNWQITTDLQLEAVVVESAHRFLMPGTVVAKTLWRVEERPFRAIRRFPLETPTDQMLATITAGDRVQSMTRAGSAESPEWTFTVRTRGGATRRVFAKARFTPDEIQVLIRRREIVFEGPRVEILAPEDFIAPVNGGSNAQRFPWCAQMLYLSEADLRTRVREGKFDRATVEALLAGQTPTGGDTTDGTEAIQLTRADQEGVDLEGDSSVRAAQYRVLEAYRTWDVDGDDEAEEIVCWVSPDQPAALLGWDYLDNLCAHGRRPFRMGSYFPMPGQLYGKSFPQIVKGIQEEINTIHNQRVDGGTLQNSQNYFYPANFIHTPDRYRLKPGQGIPVDRPNEIQMIQWQFSPVFGQNEEALLYQYFERLTGLTDLALGRQPNRVGATRTATGVASLLSEAGLRFKTSMLAFQRFWLGIFEDILALDQQYLPPGKEFRVTGRYPEIITLESRQAIAGRYDLRMAASTETLNRSIQREDATAVLAAMANPLFLMTRTVGQKGLRRLARRYLRAYGEPDPDLVLEAATDAPIRTPDQEHAMFVSGDLSAQPHPGEDLADHILKHQTLLADAAMRDQLGPTGVAALEAHQAKTVQMQMLMQTVQMMGQRGGEGGMTGSPVAGQQAMNAATGRTAGMGGGAPASPNGFGQGMGATGPMGMLNG